MVETDAVPKCVILQSTVTPALSIVAAAAVDPVPWNAVVMSVLKVIMLGAYCWSRESARTRTAQAIRTSSKRKIAVSVVPRRSSWVLPL